MMEVVELPEEANPPRSNQFTVDDLDIEILPLIYEIIRRLAQSDNTDVPITDTFVDIQKMSMRFSSAPVYIESSINFTVSGFGKNKKFLF